MHIKFKIHKTILCIFCEWIQSWGFKWQIQGLGTSIEQVSLKSVVFYFLVGIMSTAGFVIFLSTLIRMPKIVSSLKGQGTEKKRYKLFSFVLPPFFVSLCMINTVLNSKVKLPLSPPVSPTHFHVPKTGKYCCFFQYANQINCVCKFLFFFPKRSGYIIDIMF